MNIFDTPQWILIFFIMRFWAGFGKRDKSGSKPIILSTADFSMVHGCRSMVLGPDHSLSDAAL